MVSNHIVHSYDRELTLLTESIVNMGNLVSELLSLAQQSLNEFGSDFVTLANEKDLTINKYDEIIEQRATTLMALRQPMAIDLRQAISAMKLAVIMERMGDLAKNITKRAKLINSPINQDITKQVINMMSLTQTMLDDVLKAFQTNDDHKALFIADQDNQVDAIYSELMDKLTEEMLKKPASVKCIMQVIFAAKNIERIADYVTKIAKITHYIITGERINKRALTA